MKETQKFHAQIDKIVFARYGRHAREALDSILNNGVSVEDLSSQLIARLLEAIDNPMKYPNYEIPDSVLNNREKLLPELNRRIEKVSKRIEEEKKAELYKLFVDKNWLVKYIVFQWFILNPGLDLEIIQVKDDLPDKLKDWLKYNYTVSVGDEVVHRHVIPNEEREALNRIGLNVPYLHWDKLYYVDAMKLTKEIVRSNPNCKGILSDGSWTYDPKLYEIAPDGKPFASFTFLSDDRLVGERFFLEKAELGNDQENQFLFATRSNRRKKYVEEGILDIDVYAVFYPRKRLLSIDFDNL